MVVGFLEFMSERWLLNLFRRVLPVSPTYCLEQMLHVIRYIRLEDEQLQFLRIGYILLYVELRKVFEIEIDLHVEHFVEWQGLEEVVGKDLKVTCGGLSYGGQIRNFIFRSSLLLNP